MTATKSALARFKALEAMNEQGETTDEGVFEALVSVFNNIDSYGDVVMPGAFTDTLEVWAAKAAAGAPLPAVWSHKWDDPFSIIGSVLEARETDEGLVVKAQIDLDNAQAVQVYRLLKAGLVTQFSFAFDVIEGGWGIRKNDAGEERDVYELRKLDLTEVGPCLRGVNRETALLDIKGEPPARTSPERKGDPGSAAPSITADAVTAWAFANDPEGVQA